MTCFLLTQSTVRLNLKIKIHLLESNAYNLYQLTFRVTGSKPYEETSVRCSSKFSHTPI